MDNNKRKQNKTKQSERCLECVLRDDTFGLPAEGMRYTVASLTHSRQLLQWGITDHDGRFRIMVSKSLPGQLAVSYYAATGEKIAGGELDVRTWKHEFRIKLQSWLDIARTPGKVQKKSGIGRFYSSYREKVDYLERVASEKRLSIKDASSRCLQTAYKLDYFHSLLERFLHGKPEDARELLTFLQRQNKLRSAQAVPKSIKSQANQAGKTLSLLPKASLLGGQKGCYPAFGPGMGDLYAQVVDIGRMHPGLGRQLLDVMFNLNRNVLPVIRSHTVSTGPGNDPDYLDPDLLDPVNRDLTLNPDENWTMCDVFVADCENRLTEAAWGDEPAIAASSGGGQPAIKIISIAPSRHIPGTDLITHIIILTSIELPDSVSVSFPAANERVEVQGTVRQREQKDEGWLYNIDAPIPRYTIEGLLQIEGQPPECLITGGQNAGPVLDPGIMRCLGGGEPSRPTDLQPLNLSCEASLPNWYGSAPEIHFRWFQGENNTEVQGDVWLCSKPPASGWRIDPSRLSPKEERIDTANGDIGRIRGDWIPIAGDDRSTCCGRHESVPFFLEADHDLVLDYRVINEPDYRPAIKISEPMDVSCDGAPRHLVRGTYYHFDWGSIPADAWVDIGVGSTPSDGFVPIRVFNSALHMISQPKLQLLKMVAWNQLGANERVLEIFRIFLPARVRSIVITPEGRELGPDETITVDAAIVMPTYARMGVDLTVKLNLGGNIVETSTFNNQTGREIPVRFTKNLGDFDLEGQIDVGVDVEYQFSASAPVEFRSQGVMTGNGKTAVLTVLPRIAIFGITGFNMRLFDPDNVAGYTILDDGSINQDNWAVATMRGFRDMHGSDVRSLTYIGMNGESAEQVNPGGCIHLFACEWNFRDEPLGAQDPNLPPWPAGTPLEPEWVNQWMDSSGARGVLENLTATGRRRTHFLFFGHSRGGGAIYNILSSLRDDSERFPSDKWSIRAVIYLDAMHTSGFFQPVRSFPVCADVMRHYYATVDTFSDWLAGISGDFFDLGGTQNVPWVLPANSPLNDSEKPNCSGCRFDQFAVNKTHGEVITDPAVMSGIHNTIPGTVRSILHR